MLLPAPSPRDCLFPFIPNDPVFCMMLTIFKHYISQILLPFCYPRMGHSHLQVWIGFSLSSGLIQLWALSLVHHCHFIHLSLAPRLLCSYQDSMVHYVIRRPGWGQRARVWDGFSHFSFLPPIWLRTYVDVRSRMCIIIIITYNYHYIYFFWL